MPTRALLLVVALAAPALRAESPVDVNLDTLVPPAERVGAGASPDAAPADAPAGDAAAAADTPRAAPEPSRPPPWPAGDPAASGPAPAPMGLSDIVGPILKTFLMLGVVLAIAYLSLHKGLGKLVERQTSGKRVKVVERIGLDQKRSLYLVDVDGHQMLLGASDQGLTHLKDLGAPPATSAAATDGKGGLGARFADALDRTKEPRPVVASVPREQDASGVVATEGVKS